MDGELSLWVVLVTRVFVCDERERRERRRRRRERQGGGLEAKRRMTLEREMEHLVCSPCVVFVCVCGFGCVVPLRRSVLCLCGCLHSFHSVFVLSVVCVMAMPLT